MVANQFVISPLILHSLRRDFLLLDVLKNLFGRSGKQLGILHVSLHQLEGGGKIISVTDTLVGNGFKIDISLANDTAVLLDHRCGALDTVSKEHGKISEIIDMMVYGLDSERSHAGDDHGAVEGAEPGEKTREQAEIIKEIQELHRPAQKKSGNIIQYLCKAVKAAFIVVTHVCLHHLVELAVYVVDGIRGLENDLYTGVVGVNGHMLFDRHDHLDLIARKDLLTAYKAVDAGTLGDGADVGSEKNVKKSEISHSIFDAGAAEGVDPRNLKAVGVGVLGIASLGHYVGHYSVHGVYRAQLAAVVAVAESSATCRLHFRSVL